MSNLPPPPSPPGGWPQQPEQPNQGQWPGSPPGAPPPPYGAPAPPGAGGPWGAPSSYGSPAAGGYGYGPEKANFGQRLVALIVDGLITGLFIIPAIVVLFAGPTEEELCHVDASGNVDVFDEGPDNAICEVPTDSTVAMTIGLFVAAGVAGIVYHARMTGKTGQTVGAKAMGIRVVDINTGQPIGVGRGVGRYFAAVLSSMVCYLGYLWMLWDPQRQTWHDKMTSSVVIRS